ncbi:hypothetical protein D3C75_977920 [compost metagenome]
MILHEEGPDIQRPVRRAGHTEVETAGNLPAQRLPVGGGVTGPGDRGIQVLPGISGACQIDHPLR